MFFSVLSVNSATICCSNNSLDWLAATCGVSPPYTKPATTIYNIFCESSLPFPIDNSRSFSAKRSVDLIRSIVVSSRFSYDPRVFIAFMHHVRVVFDTPTSTIYRSVYVYCMFDRFLGYRTHSLSLFHWAVKTIAWMDRERYMKLRQCTYICYGSYADCISIMKRKTVIRYRDQPLYWFTFNYGDLKGRLHLKLFEELSKEELTL